MDQILIKDLLARGIIGVTDRERETPQDILINVTIFTDTLKASKSDDVEDSVNYRTIAKRILAFVETSRRHTVEALAGDLASLCLEDTNIESVSIRVEKPGAVRFARSVGVEITRSKAP